MDSPTFDFDCPHCGQALSGKQKHVGKSFNCPKCNTAFTVPAPSPVTVSVTVPVASRVTASAVQGGKTSRPRQNPSTVPVIYGTALAIIAIGAGIYFFAHNSKSVVDANEKPSPTHEMPKAALTPSAPPPKPVISEETKSRIANFLDKAGKLRVMTEQGLQLKDLTVQLSDVRGTWESISTFGLPQHLKREETLLNTAVMAWALAQEMWSSQTKATAEAMETPSTDIYFLLTADRQYSARLEALSSALRAAGINPIETADFSNEMAFEKEIIDKLFRMTKLMNARMEQEIGPIVCAGLLERQASVITAIRKAFGSDGLPKPLMLALDSPNNISVIASKTAEHELRVHSGSLSEVNVSKTKLELAKLNEKLAELKVAVYQVFVAAEKDAANKPPPLPSRASNRVRAICPDRAVKWCLNVAASAMDTARAGIAAHVKSETK